ncbi:hypothetical protein RIR_e14189_A0A2I1EBB8_9GLOM [Rhizophagus irregularis DAOM 181602=DAOM 197198]|nr:hypothetical protein RhiirB3_432461 [Rhizophagus irregularis]GET54606.1 hypothetical protein RIR_e14189_A0A2I1EBB8_9GLOM [Rhizophagus irregularis DAOM 181602=DAOM 197198]
MEFLKLLKLSFALVLDFLQRDYKQRDFTKDFTNITLQTVKQKDSPKRFYLTILFDWFNWLNFIFLISSAINNLRIVSQEMFDIRFS